MIEAVFASRNRHKTGQVKLLLQDEVALISLDDVAPDLRLEEPFDTFEENARAKASAVVAAVGLPAIADDSGLEVDGLGGAPGVRSARYAGEVATDKENNALLVARLAGVEREGRRCRYRCAAVMLFPGGVELVAEGACEGEVVLDGRGTLGFGYDPHVVPRGETRTMGEIPLDEKLAFSHRGRAFRDLAAQIRSLQTYRGA